MVDQMEGRSQRVRHHLYRAHQLLEQLERQTSITPLIGQSPSSVDNGLMESFWSTMQRELLDRRDWESQAELGSAIFEWIERFYNPRRRHSR